MDTNTDIRRLRLWPALVIVALQLAAMFLPRLLFDSNAPVFMAMIWGPAIGSVLLAIWWMLLSGVPWRVRWLGLISFGLLAGVGWLVLDESMKLGWLLYSLPTATTLAILWLLIRPHLKSGALVAAAVGFFFWAAVRVEGVTGRLIVDFDWRWRPTAEQQFLATQIQEAVDQTVASADDSALVAQPGDWSQFRGPRRDSRVEDITIRVEWPPDGPPEIWRRKVGPGWSSFILVAGRLFTQEQRGDDECVVCYDASSAEQIWEHRDATRFEEVVGGAGPRGTPTFSAGRIYAMGASGTVNCLDAQTGDAIWSRNLVADTDAKVPTWGFSSSPLVVDQLVVVYAGAGDGKSIVAYDSQNGDLKWTAGDGKSSYSSAHAAVFNGEAQILISANLGLDSFNAAGERLWSHAWKTNGVSRVVQPALLGDGEIIFGTGTGYGTRRIRVSLEDGDWNTEEVWTDKSFKPYFNDFVVHDGHAYGFDNNIFACVDLETGKRVWKRGRYGNGQVVLAVTQGLLIVLSERGEVVLLEANPERHVELARFDAIDGKTWNHPILAHGLLFVRNGAEAACFDLSD